MSFKIQFKGVEEKIGELKELYTKIQDEVDFEIGATCEVINEKQINRIPVDNGTAKQFTKYYQVGKMDWKIGSYMKYAPYLNWGTITKVSVEQDWQDIAIKFKGKGLRKTGGITPTFFFSGPVNEEMPKLIERLKEIIK